MGQIWHNKIPIKVTNKVYLYNTFGAPKIWTKKSYKKIHKRNESRETCNSQG